MSPTPLNDRSADELNAFGTFRGGRDVEVPVPREPWYRWLFEESLDGVLLTTPRGGILAANHAICDLLGYSEMELCRLGRAGILDAEDPRLSAALEERRRTGRFSGVLTCIARDGRRIPVDVTSRVFTDENGNELTSLFVRDATERLRAEAGLRESEQRFHLALRGSPTNLFTADTDLRYTWTYDPPRLLPGESIIGRRDDEIFPPEQVTDLIAIKRAVIETGKSIRREVRLVVRNEEHLYDMTVVPMRDAEGKVIGLTAAATDISERWRYEQERAHLLQEAFEARAQAESEAERARHAIALRDRVLAIVSHDLRNPLTAILLAINGLEREMPVPHAEPLEWFIDVARPAVTHMQRLILDLLDMANIEAGQLALKRAPADVTLLLERARNALDGRFEAAGIRCDYEVANDLPLADVDSERIHQVLGNLLSNALNVVPRGGSVSMAARRERDTIVISVRDTGPGIAPGDRPHIFEPFWRAQGAQSEGTGLGLNIARAIIEGHGGRIWVDETQSEGATFLFSVPVVWTERMESGVRSDE